MAHTKYLKLNQKVFHVLGLVSVFLLIQKGGAFEFRVGGSKATWAVPDDPNASMYNQWAQKNRFHIGDSLLFVYAPDHDSVLRVTKEDYTNCNTSSPLQKFNNGHTIFTFNQSGFHYFISGVSKNCLKNEKMLVIVMADRSSSKRNSNETVSSPSPSPLSPILNPTPAPSQDFSPPAPSQESTPPRNGAPSIVTHGFFGSVAVVFLSSVVVRAIFDIVACFWS